MSMLKSRVKEGQRAALAAFGISAPAGQPSLGSIGIKAPTSAPGLPSPAKVPAAPKAPAVGGDIGVPKVAFNVGIGASTSSDGAGSRPGEPADTGRRQRSVVDRTFQANEDNFATSSMPLPGDTVSP